MEWIQYCSDIGGFLGFVVFYLLLKQRATDKRLEEGDNLMKELSKNTNKLCEDVSFEGGLGRKVTLTYRTAEGAAVTVVSLYPARMPMEKADYTFSGTTGLPLAGLRSVRMENASAIRMHAQGPDALYVVTLPHLSASALRTLTSTLQLYQGD